MQFRKNISTLKVHHNKHTAGCQPIRVAPPKEVLLPMNMHSGSPAEPIVAVGDYVRVGQLIAKPGEGMSCPVHATVSGTVTAIEPMKQADGRSALTIKIESDGKMEQDPNLKPPVFDDVDGFLAAVKDSGVVGLGGAAFPLWGKLDAIRKNQIDTVLVNAAECEPYITSDTRMMVDHTDLVVKGVHLLHKWMNAKKVVICIEDNKQEAIAKLREALAGEDWAEIFILPAIYPQGAKQVLLYNVTGQVVKGGQRMASMGVIIINVSSTAKMAEYMETGMPLVDRIVTIDGSAVKEPKNLIAPIGTPISYLVEQAGGLSCEPGKVLIGGPMLGAAVASMDEPSKKATNSLLFLTEKEAKIYEPTACIRCGRCVANCPVSLNPAALARAMENENEDVRFVKLQEYSVGQCIECACCSYVCPAHKPLMESNKQGKRFVKKYKAAHAEGGK